MRLRISIPKKIKDKALHTAVLCALCCGLSGNLAAQADTTAKMVADTISLKQKMIKRWKMEPVSPLKATVFSAVLPGAGQAYNKKYWKIPIAVGGEAACIWFIMWNNAKYHEYKKAYLDVINGRPSPYSTYTPQSIFNSMEQRHRWRDLSWIALGAVHILQILDANVDAHLAYFDVGENLGLTFHPSIVNTERIIPALGITLHL